MSTAAWSRAPPRAHARLRLQLPLPPHARGVVRIERLRLTTAHPFGLFRAWTWVHTPLELLVYPRPGRPAAHAGRRMRSAPGARARGGTGARRVARAAAVSRRRLAAPGRLEGLCARGAAAGEGVQPARLGAAAVSILRSVPGAEAEARLDAAGALDRGRGGAGDRYGLELPGTRVRARPRPASIGTAAWRRWRGSVPDPRAGARLVARAARGSAAATAGLGVRSLRRRACCCTLDRVPAWASRRLRSP